MAISSSSLHSCDCRLNFKPHASLLPSTFSPAVALPSSSPIQNPDCCNPAKVSAKKTRKRWAAQSSENQAAVVAATENLLPAGNGSASDVIRNFYGGINGNDLASVNDLIADNCVYEDLIFSQPFVGRKAILEFFQKFIGSVSRDLQFVIDDISEEDNSAVGVMWHLEWKGKPFPFSKGCSFYRLDVINGRRQIIYGRDCVEPAIKPGETALAAIRGVTWLLQQFPQLADRL
ncbi:hypothetical protein NMG60_11035810 [Bertholletia excelsa]